MEAQTLFISNAIAGKHDDLLPKQRQRVFSLDFIQGYATAAYYRKDEAKPDNYKRIVIRLGVKASTVQELVRIAELHRVERFEKLVRHVLKKYEHEPQTIDNEVCKLKELFFDEI